MQSKPLLAYRWEMLIWLWFAFFFNQADRQVFGTVLSAIRTDLHLTDVQVGWIATIFTAALALTVPFAGYVGDVCNRARVITFSLLGWSVATTMSGFGSSLMYLILVRSVATGAGEAFYAPAANALIAEHHIGTRGRAMAIHQTSLYAGVIASGLAAGWIADRFGWRASFWVFGAFGIVLAAFTAWRLKPRNENASAHPSVERPAARAVARVLIRPTVLLLTAGWACMVFVNIGYLTWTPSYLSENFGLSLASAGFSSMFYHHLAAFVGVMAGGALSDRFAARSPSHRPLLQGLALLLGAPFLFFLGSNSSQAGVFIALAGFGFFRGIYDAGIYASFFEVIEPRLRATAIGLVIALVYLFGALAPVVLAMLKGGVGMAGALSLLSVAYIVGGIALLAGAKFAFARDHRTAMAVAAA